METLPALLLGLSTGKPGDAGEPIVLDGAGAGPSGSGRDRTLEPPTDSDDSDFEELSRRDFDAALASRRLTELVAPGLVVKTVVHNGKEMRGVLTNRPLKKCEPIGIYDGLIFTSDEYNSTTRPLAKAYAFEMSPVQVEDTDLRLIIVPALLPDGSGVDFTKHPLAAMDEPDPGKTANCYVQQVQVDPASMKGPGPSNALEPYVCLACATRPLGCERSPCRPRLTPPCLLLPPACSQRGPSPPGRSSRFVSRATAPASRRPARPCLSACERRDSDYGGKYDAWQTTVTCPRNLMSLFPDGIPWSALALITEDMLEPEPVDRGDDGEWRPNQRRRR